MAGGKAGSADIYFEHVLIGNSVKVSAIDAATGLEVSIVGPRGATQQSLESLALRKLQIALLRASSTSYDSGS